MMIRKRIVVRGRVQGIGYRPFVAELAEKLNITGWVRNTSGIVTIEANGRETALEEFIGALSAQAPVGSLVKSVSVEDMEAEDMEAEDLQGFFILDSDETRESDIPLIPADLPTCPSCNRELHDSSNRRYRHPFISCTACGPRYSIIEGIPYDRDTITMKDFDMCPECAREYSKKGDRRRHAQTIACRECGPSLSFIEAGRGLVCQDNDEAMSLGIDHIAGGGILAVKDIGGYHLLASPYDQRAVDVLRTIKGRETKPFAICFPEVEAIMDYCQVSEQEEELLLSDARPIVLLKRKGYCQDKPAFCENVCSTSPDIGAMLPCNPVQIMLTEALGPLIMTSANISGELITIDNDRMISWMEASYKRTDKSLGFAVLAHDRRILVPLDDSIQRIVCGKVQTIRRARGYVPDPIDFPFDRQVFAAGGDLKSCFCFTGGGRAYLSQHLGDLVEEGCYDMYQYEMARMQSIFGFEPELRVCDLHPGYRSSIEDIKFQHHKCHVASVVAEHRLRGRVLGFAFDGTGYGEDAGVWGSEVFLWEDCRKSSDMTRVASLRPRKLIGGDEGARNADTILYGYRDCKNQRSDLVRRAISMGLNTVTSTSMGRLFDAISAFLDVCHYNSYEGEAPIMLENLASQSQEAYPLAFELVTQEDGALVMDPDKLFSDMEEAMAQGISRASLARGFINALADVIVEIVEKVMSLYPSEEDTAIVVSGGSFLNRILLEKVTSDLQAGGYSLYRNQLVPPGDGGICLGQAYLACLDY